MKKLRKIIVTLLVLILVAVLIVMLTLDQLVKTGVEKGATFALGVDTTLGSADLSVLGGGIALDRLRVANPQGYESAQFFAMNHAEVEVALGSLMRDTVEVPLVAFQGIEVSLEKRDGKANYKVILDNLGRFESGAPAPQEPVAEKKGGKRLVIRKLLIEDVKVSVDLLPIGGSLTRQDVTIPKIEMTNVGSDSDRGVLVADVAGIVIKAVLKSIIDSGIDLPGDMLKELSGGLANLGSVGQYGVAIVGDVGSKVQDLGKQVGQQVGEVGKDVGEAVGKTVEDVGKNVTEGIGGLFKGKQQDSDNP